MKHLTLAMALGALVLTSGCDEDTRSLETAQDQALAGDTTAIANTLLDCDPTSAACAKNHWIKADACLKLAQQEVSAGRASGAEARSRAGCATDSYTSALRGWSDAQGTVRAGQLEAQRVSRQVSRSASEGARWNSAMGRSAAAFAATFPARAAGSYYAGDALFWDIVRTGGADCAGLQRVASLAGSARAGSPVPGGPPLGSAIATLEQQASAQATRAGCS